MLADRLASTILAENSTDGDKSSHSIFFQIRHLNQSRKVFMKYRHSCTYEHRLYNEPLEESGQENTPRELAMLLVKLSYIIVSYIYDASVFDNAHHKLICLL